MSRLWLRRWPVPWARVLVIASATFTTTFTATLTAPVAGSWFTGEPVATVWAAPAQQTEPVQAAPSAGLGPEALANAEYLLGQVVDETVDEALVEELTPEDIAPENLVQLRDGAFADETRRVQLLPQWTVYGDFTGDGAEDAAVILEFSEPGQLGRRYDLAIVVEQDGSPLNLATLTLGQPISIRNVEMDEGEIGVNLIELAPEEPTGELPVTFLFVLDGDQILQYEIPGLTPDLLANATYPNLTVADGVTEEDITLVDGEFSDEEAAIDVGLTGDVAFGDLNGDRVPDAALILVGSGGGTGVFLDLAAVLNLDGEPAPVDTVFLGDRVQIEDLWIEGGRVLLDVITHGPEDPMCCPTQTARLAYALENDTLTELEIEQPVRITATAFGPLLPMLGTEGYGYINLAGEQIIEPQFQTAYPFVEGLAAVSLDGDTFGYIDAAGALVIEPQFAYAGDFHQGVAVVGLIDDAGQEQGQAYINRRGELLFDGATFAASHDFYEGLAVVRLEDIQTEDGQTQIGPYGYIDRRGELVIEARFDTARHFSGGLALVSLDGQYGFINRSGNIAIAAQFTRGGTFAEGLAAVEIFNQFGYINMLGDLIIRPQFETAAAFREGAALVTLEGQTLYIDPQGNVLNADLSIDSGGEFHEGLAAISVDGLVGYIDSAGQMVIEPQFLGGGDFEDGLAVVRTEDTLGVIDPAGEWVLQLPAR
jgi:hypothetical protein